MRGDGDKSAFESGGISGTSSRRLHVFSKEKRKHSSVPVV